MNSGSVSLLSNRQSVMAITFCLLSFYSFFKMRLGRAGGSVAYLLSILFFALAVFTKESAIPLILVFMAADLLYFLPANKLWIHYVPYFAVLVLRYIAAAAARVSLPFGGTVPDYQYILGMNILNNLVYYLSWLLLPAVVVIAALYLLSAINKLKIDMDKAFPREISIFGLSFAIINVLLYLPFAGYRQLGWMHMSTIGMVIFLASPTYYFLGLLSSKRGAKRPLMFAAVIVVVFLIVISAIFLPSKLILRNKQAGHSKRFISDFVRSNIGNQKKVYIVDIGSKDFRLSDTFVSPMTKKDVLYQAIFLFIGDKAPKDIHLVGDAKDIGRIDANTVILYYRDGKLLRK
jgi:hypothetical protein